MNDMIEKYLLDRFNSDKEEHWQVEDNVYHASDTSKCPRKVYFKHVLDEKERDFDLDTCRNFQRGNVVENFAKKVLIEEYGYRRVGNSISINVGFDNFELVGETDPVIFGENGEISKLFEVKSKRDNNFKFVKDEPQENHVRQVHTYMKGLGLDKCYMWYIKLPDFEDVMHEVSFSDVVWFDIVNSIEKVYESIVARELPVEGPLYDWECNYCTRREECEHGS